MKTELTQVTGVFRAVVMALIVVLTSVFAAAQTETAIYTFNGEPDGSDPFGAVVFDRSGNLYGTTEGGGAFNEGSVYKLTRSGSSWTETVLYSLGTSSSDGKNPMGALVFDSKGNLYGSAAYGGVHGGGTVFELSPPASSGGAWTETILHSFPLVQNNNQSVPCGLLWVKGLHLFGIATFGGTGYGSVFELTPPATSGGSWRESTVYSFTGENDGRYPGYGCSALIDDSSGNLYGTTDQGGTGGYGTVFELSPPATSGGAWTETVLHNFDYGTTDGYFPYGAVAFDAHGNLFGTTDDGGANNAGVVYELSPAGGGTWTESVIYNFGAYSTDAYASTAGVLFDKAGNMYGTALNAVTTYDGVVWELTPPATSGGAWTETVLHGFTDGPDGGHAHSGLIAGPGGALYGTTQYGGNSSEDGVVYRVIP